MSILLQLTQGFKAYGPKLLFDSARFSINRGEHIGLIGPNGAGKSTLMKILIEKERLDSGNITKTKGLKIGYLQQEDNFDMAVSIEALLTEMCITPIWGLKSLGKGLGLTEQHFQLPLSQLSGGYRMRFKLLLLLGQEPDLLLLDEPTNYLDLESTIVLEQFLKKFKGAFILISHDREFLRQTTNHILEIEAGKFSKFDGHIDDYFEQKAAIREIMQKHAQNVENQKAHLQKFVDRFRAKATKAKQAQSRLKMLGKLESVEVSALPVTAKIRIPNPDRTGRELLLCENLSLGYGDKKIISSFQLRLERGDHVGIVGVNGAGKTTLLKSLAGELPPIEGSLKWGHNVKIGYYAQHVPEALDPQMNIEQALGSTAHPDSNLQDVKDMAGSLLFSDQDILKPIKILSGGEKARVALGKMLLQRFPCLLLDEPTNHLDFQTVEALTQALQTYNGSIIVVSHDRSFIGRVARKILEIRDGVIDLFPGTYDEYVWSLKNGAWSDKKSASEEVAPTEQLSRSSKNKASHSNRKELNKNIRQKQAHLKRIDKKMNDTSILIESMADKMSCCSGDELHRLQTDIAYAQTEKEELETEWMELSEELEQLEIEFQGS